MHLYARLTAAVLSLTAFAAAAETARAAQDNLPPAVKARFDEIERQLIEGGLPAEPGEDLKRIDEPVAETEWSSLAEHQRSGKVYMLLLIAPDGRVADIVVVDAEPFGVFEPHALGQAKWMRFSSAPPGSTAFRFFRLTIQYRVI